MNDIRGITWEEKRKREWWMQGDRLAIGSLTTSWALVWIDTFCWHLESCVHYSEFTLSPIYRECLTLFEMMSLASHFQNNRPLPPLPMTRSPLLGLVEITGDKHLLSLGPAVIISPVFVKAAEWKQAAVKKPARQGGGGADMLWYQMKGLLKPGNWIREV